MSSLSNDAKARKDIPLHTGVFDYFPDALVGVAVVSRIGNDQHNPGQPLHWAKEKSTDHLDCIQRHLLDFEGLDTDGTLHVDKVAWRALALAQMVHEAVGNGLTYKDYIALLKSKKSCS